MKLSHKYKTKKNKKKKFKMNGGDTRKFGQFKALDDDYYVDKLYKNDNPTNKRRQLTRQNDMDADEWYNHLEDDNSRKRGHSQQNSDQPVRKSSRMRSATKRYDIATDSARPQLATTRTPTSTNHSISDKLASIQMQSSVNLNSLPAQISQTTQPAPLVTNKRPKNKPVYSDPIKYDITEIYIVSDVNIRGKGGLTTNENTLLDLKNPLEYFNDNSGLVYYVNAWDGENNEVFWVTKDSLINGKKINDPNYKDFKDRKWEIKPNPTLLTQWEENHIIEQMDNITLVDDAIKVTWKKKVRFTKTEEYNKYPTILSLDYFNNVIVKSECDFDNIICKQIKQIILRIGNGDRGIDYSTFEQAVKHNNWGTLDPITDIDYYNNMIYSDLENGSVIRDAMSNSAATECQKCESLNKDLKTPLICYGLRIRVEKSYNYSSPVLGMAKFECEHIANFLQVIKYTGTSSTYWESYFRQIFIELNYTTSEIESMYNYIKSIFCECYGSSSMIFNQIKSNIDVINFKLVNNNGILEIEVTPNYRNLDIILDYILNNKSNPMINGSTYHGWIGINKFMSKWSNKYSIDDKGNKMLIINNIPKIKELAMQKIKEVSTVLNAKLNGFEINGEIGFKNMYIILGRVLTKAIMTTKPPTSISRNKLGAIFQYKDKIIAPKFLEEYGNRYIVLFNEKFNRNQSSGNNLKGGGETTDTIIELDRSSNIFLKKYERTLETVFTLSEENTPHTEPISVSKKVIEPHTPNMMEIEEGGGSKKTEKKHKKKYNGGRTVRTKRTGQNHKRNEKTKKKNKKKKVNKKEKK